MKIKTASVQFNHAPGDKTYNLARIHDFCVKAAEEKVELIIFPEMCITGYWHVRNLKRTEIEELAEALPDGASVQYLQKLSCELNIIIGAGLIEAAADGQLYNTYVVVKPDGSIFSHRKIHCFISKHMASGSEFTVFELCDGIKAGILICYDNNIIENARITALLGADILLAPHQTGGCETPSPLCMGRIDTDLWDQRQTRGDELLKEVMGPKGRGWLMKWLPARAHDNGMFLIFSNGIGRDDDEVRTGNAMIIDPYGNILAEAEQAEDLMVWATLDMDLLHKCIGRRWIISRRPELYKMLSQPTGKEQDVKIVRFE